jgi:hypothetical protein
MKNAAIQFALKSFKEMTDSQLYQFCKKYGALSLEARRKFAGALPEVFRRKLHRKYGYASIHEFAAKLAGMSQSSVDKILRLDKKLEDKPALKALLSSGKQGWSKIERVAYIATPETDKSWANKVQNLPAPALSAYVREVKNLQNFRLEVTAGGELKNKNQSTQNRISANNEALPNDESLFNDEVSNWRKITINISPETEKQLRVFKQKNGCLTFEEALRKLLVVANKPNKQRKKSSSKPVPFAKSNSQTSFQPAKSRKPSRQIEKIIERKYQGCCGFPGCFHAATSLHHTRRFALCPDHNPDYIVPLCDAHERLIHSGLIENETDPPEKWRLRLNADLSHPKRTIDRVVQKFRKLGQHKPAWGVG